MKDSGIAHIEREVDQVLGYTGEHLDTGQDVLHMVMDIGKVDCGSVCHITLPLLPFLLLLVVESYGSVEVVPA